MRIKEIFAILLPIIICIIVFFLPMNIQNLLALDISKPNYWSWVSYVFVHSGIFHLVSNLIIFLLACIFAYYLFPKKDRKIFSPSRMGIIFLLVVILTFIFTLLFRLWGLFPINLIFFRGFSGISSAFIGVLGIALSKNIKLFLTEQRNKKLSLVMAQLFFVPALAVMMSNFSWIFYFFILIVLGFVGWFLIYLVKHEKIKIIKRKLKDLNYVLVLSGLVLYLFGSTLLTPSNIIQNGSVVNSFAHLIGFAIGFWICFFLTRD